MNNELERRIKEKEELIKNLETSPMMDRDKVLKEQKAKLHVLKMQR